MLLQRHPLTKHTVEELLDATKLLTWEQLYPLLEGMAHDSIGSEQNFAPISKTVAAFEALRLLVGESMLYITTNIATTLCIDTQDRLCGKDVNSHRLDMPNICMQTFGHKCHVHVLRFIGADVQDPGMLKVIAELTGLLMRVLENRVLSWKLIGDPTTTSIQADVVDYSSRQALLLSLLELVNAVVLKVGANLRQKWLAAGKVPKHVVPR